MYVCMILLPWSTHSRWKFVADDHPLLYTTAWYDVGELCLWPKALVLYIGKRSRPHTLRAGGGNHDPRDASNKAKHRIMEIAIMYCADLRLTQIL